MNLALFIKQTLNILADLFSMLIFLRIVLSWFKHEASGLMKFLYQSTEPVLAPIRRSIPTIGIFDLSPLIALLLIEIARILINNYL